MNLTEWILASATVLLWLYAWSVKHSVTVVDEALKRESARRQESDEILVRAIDKLAESTSKHTAAIYRLVHSKQDAPLLRRKTDKK